MKAEKARSPITDFIKVWCELCRIRIDAREERTDVGGKTYHPDCYSTLFAAAPKPTGYRLRAGFQSLHSRAATIKKSASRSALNHAKNDISQQLCPHDQTAVVVDQSRFPEFVHEVINAGACRAYHFSQDLVTEQGYCGIGHDVVFTQTGKLQEHTGEPV